MRLAFAILSLALASAAQAAPPPAEALGRIPQIEQAAISADGTRLAVLGGHGDQPAVTVAAIGQAPAPALALGDADPISLRWAGDYVLVRAAVPFTPRGGPRLRYRLERWISIDAQRRAAGRLLDNDPASAVLLSLPLVGVSNARPGQAFVAGASSSASAFGFTAGLWSVDPATGHGAFLESGHSDTVTWAMDRDGQPRVRVDGPQIYVRDKGAKIWRLFFDRRTDPSMSYLGFSPSQSSLIFRRIAKTGETVVSRNLAGGADTTVWTGATRPFPIWDDKRGDLVAVQSLADGAWKTDWFDDDLASVQATITAAITPTRAALADWSEDRRRFVVRVQADDGPGGWFLFDRDARAFTGIGLEYPELAGVRFGATRRLALGADGPEAYFTAPFAPAGRAPPVVVIPSLEPLSQAAIGFDFLTAFLSSRGYGVLRLQLQPGEAPDKLEAVFGAAVRQTDLSLANGVAAAAVVAGFDPARVCVLGSGSDGYFALLAVARHDAFRCAIAVNAMSDVGLVGAESFRLFGFQWAAVPPLVQIARQAPRAEVDALSPLKLAADIERPVLLVHAEQNSAIPVVHARRMDEALRAANRPVEFVQLAGDDPNLLKAANRTQMLKSLEAFLARNLPVTP